MSVLENNLNYLTTLMSILDGIANDIINHKPVDKVIWEKLKFLPQTEKYFFEELFKKAQEYYYLELDSLNKPYEEKRCDDCRTLKHYFNGIYEKLSNPLTYINHNQ
jgi:hypothetical protein